jgi:anti-sigma regulatory factor (Ser/Thr protein kinase)
MQDPVSQIRLPARMQSLEAFLQFVSTYARRYGFSPKRIHQIELSVEETLVNIFHYAYPQVPGDVEVSCRIGDPRGFITEISDQGRPFDLLSVQAPDLDEDVLDRPVGGLGVHMIRKLVDEVTYGRQGEDNIVTFIFSKRDEI